AILAARAGVDIQVARVFDRSWRKKQDVLGDIPATDNADDVLDDPELDVVVELIGGLNPAYDFVSRAIQSGKNVVTANKALLARHGNILLPLARKHQVSVGFEAAVAGALPVIRNMRRSFVSDDVSTIHAILNGTSNFILTRMEEDGMDYGEALKLAQERGFAEADPTFDVGGFDAAQKLAILAALAFDTAIAEDAVIVEGIETIRHKDLRFAAAMERVIRPLAIARKFPDGRISLRVHAAMLPADHPLAAVQEEKNAVMIDTSNSGPAMIMGLGAGARPTAAAVIGDLVFLAGRETGRSQIWLSGFDQPTPVTEFEYRFYLRFQTVDRPGVLAEIARILAGEKISIASVHQYEGAEPIDLVVVTHTVNEGALKRALADIARLESILAAPIWIRMKEEHQSDEPGVASSAGPGSSGHG
ncbi:MAG: homoserine dehydrogenase, partial [Leptospirales bacterium]